MTASPFTADDYGHMARALQLAARGLASARPNPRVGCVLVKAGRVIGEGWHAQAGGPHAEIVALQAAGANARGATCYVTLEPCRHQGRTGPCTTALISAGVRTVVAAIEDPNPRMTGKGLAALRAAGIHTSAGLLAAEAERLNAGFLRRMRGGGPYVRVKVGASLDGRVALPGGESQWITSAAARLDVQRWRARSCAIVTGVGTVLADDPRLNVREPSALEGLREQPLRVILDTKLRTPPQARLFSEPGRVLIYTTAHEGERAQKLRAAAAEIETIPELDGRMDLNVVLQRLARREINEVWVEAGPQLTGAFLQARLADELIAYVAPKLMGHEARAMAELPPPATLKDAPEWTWQDVRVCGTDLRLTLTPKSGGK
jgi:diaminohydroxyphosphoribosylaminopyrimidine deaminase/5-amino-6-(5-phosphoribosylamino)uracil reductase